MARAKFEFLRESVFKVIPPANCQNAPPIETSLDEKVEVCFVWASIATHIAVESEQLCGLDIIIDAAPGIWNKEVMNTVIVSDRLASVTETVDDLDITQWNRRPSVEGYPAIVLDLWFGAPSIDQGFSSSHSYFQKFYELGICWLLAQMGQIVNRDFELISRAL